MPSRRIPLKPRKQPVQARSAETVRAILDACIQVLLRRGVDGVTTTRVAERAGVSVGSLYQYFPNKQALMAAVLDRHLAKVVDAVVRTCSEANGLSAVEIGTRVVRTFVAAKFAQRAESAVLYSASAFVGGQEFVEKHALRAQTAMTAALRSARPPRPVHPELAAFVLSTALIGPVQALLTGPQNARMESAVSLELERLVQSYLSVPAAERLRLRTNSVLT